MLSWYWSLLLAIILVQIGSLVYQAIVGYIRLSYYRKQGLEVEYYPGFGFFGLFIPLHKANRRHSNMEYVKEKIRANPARKSFVSNFPGQNRSLVYLCQPRHIKEYYLEEDQFSKDISENTAKFSELIGFFFQDGEKAMVQKAVFSKIFSYDALAALIPEFSSTVQKAFSDFANEQKLTKEEFTQVDLGILMKNLMQVLFGILLFGSQEELEKDELKSRIYKISDEIMLNLFGGFFHPLYILYPKLSEKYNLTPQLRKIEQLKQEMISIAGKLLNQSRENLAADGKPRCLFDRIVLHNIDCEQKGQMDEYLSPEKLFGTINLLCLAGTDTAENIVMQMLIQMCESAEVKSYVRDKLNPELYKDSEILTKESFESSELLGPWLKESLRMNQSITQTGMRIAKRDVKLDDIVIRKGDYCSVLTTAVMRSDALFPNSEVFDLQRFSKENQKMYGKYTYFPFGLGKRHCLGKYLGEMLVTILATMFVRKFEFARPPNHEYYLKFIYAIKVTNPQILVKLL